MLPGISIGDGLDADAGVTLGYASARQQGQRLVVGVHARVRSGTVLYLGSRIGARFQTGHNVVIREDCAIGNDVSVWSNSVVDYGCSIGDRVKIHSNCYVAQFTEIGADAFLAPGVAIANDLYPGQASSARVMAWPVHRTWRADRRQRDDPAVRPHRSRLPCGRWRRGRQGHS